MIPVLGIISDLSGVLSDLNVKSMISNWKGYMMLSQKYSDILENSIDLGTLIKILMAEIIRNLSTVMNLVSSMWKYDIVKLLVVISGHNTSEIRFKC